MTPDKEEYIRRSEERRRQRIEREEAVSKAAAEMWSRMDRAKFGPLIERRAVRQAQLANQNTPNIHTYVGARCPSKRWLHCSTMRRKSIRAQETPYES